MVQSLVGTTMRYFTPTIVERMAVALGESRDGTEKGVAAGVPALLAACAEFAAQPGGADRLAAAARQQDFGILDRLSDVIGGNGEEAVSAKGRTMLSLMLGGSASARLTEAVAGYAGLGEEAAASMIGLLAPVVVAVLRRDQASQGLDAAGLGRSLADQKDDIGGAMPLGLRADVSAAIAQAAPKPPLRAATPGWAFALAALVMLGLAAYLFAGNPQLEAARHNAAPAAASETPPAPGIRSSVIVGQVDVAKQLASILDSASQSLASVSDAASAKNALPQLQDAVAQLDQVRRMTDQIPAEGKKTLTSIVRNAKPALQQNIDKVQRMPRATPVLKPTLDSLQVRLDVFTSPAGLPPQTAQVPGAPR